MGVIAEDIQFLDPTNQFKIVVEKMTRFMLIITSYFYLGLVEIQKNRKMIDALKTDNERMRADNERMQVELSDLKNSTTRLLPLLDHPIFKNYRNK